jgi:uridine kinase
MDVTACVAAEVTRLSRARDRVLVGIDGPDAAGKSTLADQLAGSLPVPALRVSVDRFHLPQEVRHRRGQLSAEGYYQDSFDYPALLTRCLMPFRSGAPQVQTASYDYRADGRRRTDAEVPSRAILVVDGVFLLRPQLRDLWTLSVYLRVSPEETLQRAADRDLALFGSHDEIQRRYQERYLPGQALYRNEAHPEETAHIVIGNEHPRKPVIERWAIPGGDGDRHGMHR